MAKPKTIRQFEEGLAARIRMQARDIINEVKEDHFEEAKKFLVRILREDLMGEVLEKGFDRGGIEKRIEEEREIILVRAVQAKNELAKLIKENKKDAIKEIKRDKKRTIELLEIIMFIAGELVLDEMKAIRKRRAA